MTSIPAVQGIIPAKVDYSTGKLELDKNGQPGGRLRHGHPPDAAALLPHRHARAWA